MNLNHSEFLDQVISEAKNLGLDLSHYLIDHIAYQAASKEEYDRFKPNFLEMAELAREPIVGGRRVGVFKFNFPLNYNGKEIASIELIEPKEDQVAESGLEHAEFLLDDTLEDFMEKYPKLDWDTSSLNREDFAHLKLRLSPSMQIKFPRKSILSE